MMNKWFECKVKYVKTMENGLEKPVTETYLVDALSFTEAEKRFLEEIRPFMRWFSTLSHTWMPEQ